MLAHFPKEACMPWTFTYSPYTSQSGKEIPAYEIFDSKYRTVLTTNEHYSNKLQYNVACLAAKAPEFAALSEKIVRLWREGIANANSQTSNLTHLNAAIHELASLLDRA